MNQMLFSPVQHINKQLHKKPQYFHLNVYAAKGPKG